MNTKRIAFFDLARGLAIIFMIMQHGMIIYGINEGEGSFLGELIVLLGTGPAAPIFMLIMGVFFLRVKDMRGSAIRGLKLIGLGYLLNLLRFVIPTILTGDYPANGPDSPFGLLMAIDILQMAGLSLICMSLIRYIRPVVWLGLMFFVALISPMLWEYASQNQILDILWGTHHNVAFPFFPWFLYPLMGMYWGELFNTTEDIPGFMKKSAIVGTGLMIMGGIMWIRFDTPWLPRGDYSRGGIHMHMVIIGFVFVWLWLFRLIEGNLTGSKLGELLVFWSKNVTVIYVLQWVFIGWGMLIFGYQQLTPIWAAFIGLIVTILTHNLTNCYSRIQKI